VSYIRRYRKWLVLPVAVCLLALIPRTASAQRRRGPVVRSSVVVIGGYRYAPYWYYDPWFQWGPYGYPPPFGYPYYGQFDNTSSVRLEVTPRDAQVFVDGYVAGTVDDFDGVFQRLRVRPGSHQIAIYLEGYRTVVQNLYLNPGGDQKVRLTMERLRAGEVSDPPPPASEQPQTEVQPEPGRRLPGMPGPYRPGPGRPAPPPPDSTTDREAPGRFGSLSLRVQPADAEILIDGERWATPQGQDRIGIQLSEGRHHVEVRKDGFSPYTEDVLIRRGATFTLNVSLSRGEPRQ
jgi:hypothetical protein